MKNNIKTNNNDWNEELLGEFKIKIANTWIGDDKKNAVDMVSVLTKDDKYVGLLKDAQFYFDKGIIPEAYGDNKVCSIGKSYLDGKWYGWSHRAMYGFKIGDVTKEGDCTVSSGYTDEYLKENPDPYILPVGFEAKTEEDCKRMAIAFASSVS